MKNRSSRLAWRAVCISTASPRAQRSHWTISGLPWYTSWYWHRWASVFPRIALGWAGFQWSEDSRLSDERGTGLECDVGIDFALHLECFRIIIVVFGLWQASKDSANKKINQDEPRRFQLKDQKGWRIILAALIIFLLFWGCTSIISLSFGKEGCFALKTIGWLFFGLGLFTFGGKVGNFSMESWSSLLVLTSYSILVISFITFSIETSSVSKLLDHSCPDDSCV